MYLLHPFFFFSSRGRHTGSLRDWSSDVCSSDLGSQVADADEEALAELDEPASSTGAPQAARATTAVLAMAAPSRRTGRWTDMRDPSFSGPWRSEERRVGKECRVRRAVDQEK